MISSKLQFSFLFFDLPFFRFRWRKAFVRKYKECFVWNVWTIWSVDNFGFRSDSWYAQDAHCTCKKHDAYFKLPSSICAPTSYLSFWPYSNFVCTARYTPKIAFVPTKRSSYHDIAHQTLTVHVNKVCRPLHLDALAPQKPAYIVTAVRPCICWAKLHYHGTRMSGCCLVHSGFFLWSIHNISKFPVFLLPRKR